MIPLKHLGAQLLAIIVVIEPRRRCCRDIAAILQYRRCVDAPGCHRRLLLEALQIDKVPLSTSRMHIDLVVEEDLCIVNML